MTRWCIAVVKTNSVHERATLSYFTGQLFPLQCNVALCIQSIGSVVLYIMKAHSTKDFGFCFFLIKDLSFVLFLHILRHHAQKLSHTKAIMLTLYQKFNALTFEFCC